jgi:hypothetical protein
MRKLLPAITAGMLALVVMAPWAFAKEGVKATLLTNPPLSPIPGERLHLAWTLASVQDGKSHPFGANGVFVRLRSAAGEEPEIGFATTAAHADGRYAAMVVVPEGGIGDVEIGLRGWSSGPSGTHVSDMLFPITNDPLPGGIRIAASPSSHDSKAWLVVFLAVGGVVLGALALLAAHRRSRAARVRPTA